MLAQHRSLFSMGIKSRAWMIGAAFLVGVFAGASSILTLQSVQSTSIRSDTSFSKETTEFLLDKMAPTPPSKATCESINGGKWSLGVKGDQIENRVVPYCQLYTSDGGKPCSDSSECESFCVAQPAGGRCNFTRHIFGCKYTFEKLRPNLHVCDWEIDMFREDGSIVPLHTRISTVSPEELAEYLDRVAMTEAVRAQYPSELP